METGSVFMEQFLEGNVPLRHLIYIGLTAFIEVNDCAQSFTLNGTTIGEIQAGAFTNMTIDKFTVVNADITKLNRDVFDFNVNRVDDENNTAEIRAENIIIMEEIENSFNLCHDPNISCKFKNISIMKECHCELFKVATLNHVHNDTEKFMNVKGIFFKDILSGFYCYYEEKLFQWIIYDMFECHNHEGPIYALAEFLGLGKYVQNWFSNK